MSFGSQFITSPGSAGIFAVLAASLGAWQLSRQLNHAKAKSADEAWWQQFEWVTDRIISTAENKSPVLPSSLAFDLMTSLSRSANAAFQKDAVGGVLTHYLNGLMKQNDPPFGGPETTSPHTGSGMDAAGANSLRTLLNSLPNSSPSLQSGRDILREYDYTQEIIKALRHHGFEVFVSEPTKNSISDVRISLGAKQAILDVKSSIVANVMLQSAVARMEMALARTGVGFGVIVTRPDVMGSTWLSSAPMPKNIRLVVWEPGMSSSSLSSPIKSILAEKNQND